MTKFFHKSRQWSILALCISLNSSLVSVAEEAKPEGKEAFAQVKRTKFGVLDMQKIILSVEDGKEARAKLEKEIKAKEAEFLEKKKELDQLNQEWQNQSSLLTEEGKLRKQQDFQKKFIDLRNAEGKFQSDIKQRENAETQKIAMKSAKIVEALAKERDLDGVFETGSSGLIYLREPVDLTPSVIAEYEKQSKAVSKASTDKKSKSG